MSKAVDKLRQRCEEMLAVDEEILLDTECGVYRRTLLFSALGAGRAFLTGARLIWIRRSTPPPFSWLLPLISIPELIEVRLPRVEMLRRERWGLNSFHLRIRSEGREYFYRLGRGPYPLLRQNPQTSEEWFSMLERLRNPPAAKAESRRDDRER